MFSPCFHMFLVFYNQHVLVSYCKVNADTPRSFKSKASLGESTCSGRARFAGSKGRGPGKLPWDRRVQFLEGYVGVGYRMGP